MQIDRSRFPLVFLREEATAEIDAEAAFSALLDHGRPFVLIAEHHGHDEENESHEARKSRARFFKQNKDRLRALCAAAIVIEGAETVPVALRLAAQGLGKAFGLPFHFVRNEEEAIAAGRKALATHAA